MPFLTCHACLHGNWRGAEELSHVMGKMDKKFLYI
ncbi:hypothetical protein Lser_V15G02084 [Lactuca serriola]